MLTFCSGGKVCETALLALAVTEKVVIARSVATKQSLCLLYIAALGRHRIANETPTANCLFVSVERLKLTIYMLFPPAHPGHKGGNGGAKLQIQVRQSATSLLS